MLVEIKKLNISNDGYARSISIDKVYINANHIISITDYEGVKTFLISEGAKQYKDQNFSLIKLNNIKGTEDVIAVGTSQEIFETFSSHTKNKELLNG